jgi:hypothetical protein
LPYADITYPQSLNKYTYVTNNPLRYIDPEGHAVFDSAELLIKAGEKVMDMESLQPVYDSHGKLRQTFCNFGTRNILREGGDHSLDNMTAAKMTDYLSDSKHATKLSYSDAVAYAKQGVTVVMAETGHVAVVSPHDTSALTRNSPLVLG